ncbi:MAG: hypothetical protein LDL33_14215 [Desulfomonile sp.]|nr:hypothetical protein [Desulfomonile sp.]
MAQDVPINAKEALECIRSRMSNAEVMERFKITTKGYADLLKQLFRKKLITEEDLKRRGISFTYTTKQEPKPAPAVIAPPPPSEDEEFLDTAALTDLLSFKPASSAHAPAPDGPAEIGSFDDEAQSSPKKPKYSLAGLFKKSG